MKVLLDREFLLMALEIDEENAKNIATEELQEIYDIQCKEFKEDVLRGYSKWLNIIIKSK
mgnify:CR=1 FL=1